MFSYFFILAIILALAVMSSLLVSILATTNEDGSSRTWEAWRHDVVFFAPHLIPGPCWSISVRWQVLEKGALLALGPHLSTSHICRHMLQVWPRILDLWCPSLTKLWNCPSNAFGGQLCNCRFNGGNHFGTCTSDLWKIADCEHRKGNGRKKKYAIICYQAGKGTRRHATLAALASLQS